VRALLKAGAEIVVTAPVSKEGIIKSGRPFVGQTEELAKGRSKKVAMMLVNKNLKVVLTTTHLPLKKVPSALTKNKIYQIIVLADEGLKKYFNLLSPKLAVSGLNPHCGEGGMKGREEITKIIPAIKKAQQEKINVAGPFPADTLFTPEKIKGFDAMIVMYHDQGLIPVKMAGLAEVVNVTLGLPFIRTSPGHGPAFDIAGKNQAEAKSMKLAVKLALKMFERRQNNDAPCSNSLPRNRQNSYL
jgi:4-hydroxythreonine-4-phosphate dehydrogenase